MYPLAFCTSSLEKCLLRFCGSFLSLISHNLSTNPVGSTLKIHPGFDHFSPSPPSQTGPGHHHFLPRFCHSLLIILPCSPSAHSPHCSQHDPAKTKTCWATPQLRTLLWLPTWCRAKPGPYLALQDIPGLFPAWPTPTSSPAFPSCMGFCLLPLQPPHSSSGSRSELLPQAFALAFSPWLSSDFLKEPLPWLVH